MPTRILGYPRLTDIISSLKEVHGDIVLPIVFVGFFLWGGIACLQRGNSRRVFVLVTVCILLVTSQLALTIVPFVSAHRYSSFADQTHETNYLSVVDSSGNEIELDERANLPFRNSELAYALHNKWDDEKRAKIADQILHDSNEHKERVESPVPWLRHPPPSVTFYWEGSTHGEYGEFETVRVYNVETIYKENSHEIKERTETCVVEINPHTKTVSEEC